MENVESTDEQMPSTSTSTRSKYKRMFMKKLEQLCHTVIRVKRAMHDLWEQGIRSIYGNRVPDPNEPDPVDGPYDKQALEAHIQMCKVNYHSSDLPHVEIAKKRHPMLHEDENGQPTSEEQYKGDKRAVFTKEQIRFLMYEDFAPALAVRDHLIAMKVVRYDADGKEEEEGEGEDEEDEEEESEEDANANWLKKKLELDMDPDRFSWHSTESLSSLEDDNQPCCSKKVEEKEVDKFDDNLNYKF